jgi:hypothetical protein
MGREGTPIHLVSRRGTASLGSPIKCGRPDRRRITAVAFLAGCWSRRGTAPPADPQTTAFEPPVYGSHEPDPSESNPVGRAPRFGSGSRGGVIPTVSGRIEPENDVVRWAWTGTEGAVERSEAVDSRGHRLARSAQWLSEYVTDAADYCPGRHCGGGPSGRSPGGGPSG